MRDSQLHRALFLAASLLAVLGLGLPTLAKPALRLVYNASASAPLGFYRLIAADSIDRGDLVLAHLPESAARLAADRRYLPMTVPAVKRVAAQAGDVVCADSGIVLINDHVAADTLPMDREGRPLPAWWLPDARSRRGLPAHGRCARVLRQSVFLAGPCDFRYREAGAVVDLVTLFAACALGTVIHADVTCPARPPLMGQLLSVDADRPPAAQSSTANDIGGRPQGSPAIDRSQAFITEASQRFAVPESWIRAVMEAESAGQTMLDGRLITSPAGAMGLLQVMPETYTEMRLGYGLGADPYDPRNNILAGAANLRAMYDRYGYPGFFAGYNACQARLEDYLQRGVSLPEEALHYLLTKPHWGPHPEPPLDRTTGIFRAWIYSVTTPHRVVFSCHSEVRAAPPIDAGGAHERASGPPKPAAEGRQIHKAHAFERIGIHAMRRYERDQKMNQISGGQDERDGAKGRPSLCLHIVFDGAMPWRDGAILAPSHCAAVIFVAPNCRSPGEILPRVMGTSDRP